MQADEEHNAATRRVLRLTGAFVLVLLLGAAINGVAGCTVFQPQRDVAALCAQIPDQNAGVTCVKAGYAAVRDGAETVLRRYDAGRMGVGDARRALGVLEQIHEVVELAEIAVLAGDLQGAEGQLDAAIALLDTLEWSGGKTTLEALGCGLPVVTCPGRFNCRI